MSQGNPYSSPLECTMPPVPSDAPDRLDFRRAITFIADSPNWMINVLFISLCTLAGAVIPILPAVVLIGYQFEIIESLVRDPRRVYPDFQFDRVVEYLTRGLYPLLVALIAMCVAGPLAFLVVGIPLGGIILLAGGIDDQAAAPAIAVAGMLILVLVTFVVAVAINVLLVPLVLRAGLTQNVGSAFDRQFVADFARKMWLDMVLAGLFLIAVTLVAELLGLLMFCVGVFFTVSAVQLVQTHLAFQLYRVYRARGGHEIPLKTSPANVTPVSLPQQEGPA